MTKYKYIAIEGNIGAGKTSLAYKLATDLDASLVLESFEDNSFLAKFYAEPAKHALPLEISFLLDRYKQLYSLFSGQDNRIVVSDYFFDKCLIFASETLNDEEFALYAGLHKTMAVQLPKPDLILYLRQEPEQLKQFITKRGRAYEQSIKLDYLSSLNERYESRFTIENDIPVLVIDADVDFVNNEEHYKAVRNLLKKEWGKGVQGAF